MAGCRAYAHAFWSIDGMYLSLITRLSFNHAGELQIQTLDDTKKQGDTAMRAMAVEWLGEIAARIRKRLASPPFTRATVQEWQRRLPGSDVNGDTPTDSLNILWGLQKVVLDWLDVARVDDSALLVRKGFFSVISRLIMHSPLERAP